MTAPPIAAASRSPAQRVATACTAAPRRGFAASGSSATPCGAPRRARAAMVSSAPSAPAANLATTLGPAPGMNPVLATTMVGAVYRRAVRMCTVPRTSDASRGGASRGPIVETPKRVPQGRHAWREATANDGRPHACSRAQRRGAVLTVRCATRLELVCLLVIPNDWTAAEMTVGARAWMVRGRSGAASRVEVRVG